MLSDSKISAVEFFHRGRELYKCRNFSAARECFAKALEVCPDDHPSEVYLHRCEYYQEFPPDDDWDGVYVMKTK